MIGGVDVFVILHNSRQWLPNLLSGMRDISFPVTVFFLDNASTDGTADLLAAEIPSLPFRAHILRSIHNNEA